MLVSGTKNNSIGSKIHKNEMVNVYTYLITISSAHYASQSRASQLEPGWRGPQLRPGSEFSVLESAAQELASLTNPQEKLMLWAWGPHKPNHRFKGISLQTSTCTEL